MKKLKVHGLYDLKPGDEAPIFCDGIQTGTVYIERVCLEDGTFSSTSGYWFRLTTGYRLRDTHVHIVPQVPENAEHFTRSTLIKALERVELNKRTTEQLTRLLHISNE